MNGYSPGRPSPPRAPGRGGDGYGRDMINNSPPAPLRVNPVTSMKTKLPPSSALVDLEDPIQVHLLTETALTDSKQFTILSQEEVDSLKKQVQSLALRVEQTRTNLAIQTKYRDAAVSMAKLYSQPDAGKRRSLGGNNRNSMGESLREAEVERQASEKRCQDLSNELSSLEQRLIESRRSLLEHTAGILQLTHKASKKPVNQLPAQLMNGIPGSPESLYTYSNGRNSLELLEDDTFYAEDDLFKDLEEATAPSRLPKVTPLNIPPRAPERDQNNQLREDVEKLRQENAQLRAQADALNKLQDENAQLRAQTDALSVEVDSLKRDNIQRLQSVTDTERKLLTFNNSLREIIVNFNPDKNAGFREPPSVPTTTPAKSGSTIGSQFEYLEQGLTAVREEQMLQGRSSNDSKDAEAATSEALEKAEDRIRNLNQQLRDVLVSVSPSFPEVPTGGLYAQSDYLQSAIAVIEEEIKKTADKSAVKKQGDDQTEAVLMGLWEIIQSGFASIQQQKADRRRTRLEQGLTEDEDEMSGDEAVDTNEQYSLSAFSARVQWLYSQATSLKEQKSVLKRQIKQQREMNSKSDSQKDVELKAKQDQLDQLRIAQSRAEEERTLELTIKQDQLDQLRSLLERSEEEVAEAQEKLAKVQKETEAANTTRMANESSSTRTQQEIKDRDTKIASLEATTKEAQTKLQEADGKLNKANEEVKLLSTKLAAAEKAAVEKQQEVEAKGKEIKEKEEEIDRFNMMIVELKTELTIAQAELDGAYGSRKERATEAAAVKSTAEVTQLKAEVDKLKEELSSTLKELENITAETINAERDRFEVESKLDDALAVKSTLEGEVASLREQLDAEVLNSRTKMSKLQEQLDAERLKVAPGTGARGAGASMLSEQFRTTMREERKKFQEDMREEQAKRRLLEQELQKLKKAQGPGRSPLSPK